jgi:repressor LexA
MLRVQGDSMIDAGIFDKDILIIHSSNEAYNGQIVIAKVEDESYTVKRFYKIGDKIILKAENPLYQALEMDAGKVEIIGEVIGLMRTM